MKSLLGTVVVENIGGGGASIGSAAAARAQPDGYTLLTAGTLTHINEALIKNRPLYDPVRDLDPVAGIAVVVLGIVVHPSVPARDLKELAAYARTNPDKIQFAHNGLGTVNHLTYEMFRDQAALPNLVQVPYRGAGPVLVDLIGGQVTLSVVGVTSQTLEMHRTGKIRMLALTNPTRLAGAPDVPTAAEQGFPGVTNIGTIGIAAPAICEPLEASDRRSSQSTLTPSLSTIGFQNAMSPSRLRRNFSGVVSLLTSYPDSTSRC